MWKNKSATTEVAAPKRKLPVVAKQTYIAYGYTQKQYLNLSYKEAYIWNLHFVKFNKNIVRKETGNIPMKKENIPANFPLFN